MLDEIYFCVKELGFTYSDLMNIPVFERRYFINKYVEDVERINSSRKQ
tara:strand:- start:559 stop:702 length:144 start_codon:yes stop_codon:yes gene_type:complete